MFEGYHISAYESEQDLQQLGLHYLFTYFYCLSVQKNNGSQKIPGDALKDLYKSFVSEAVFELTENHFWKLFSVKSTRLAATENRFSGKSFPFDQNLHLLTRKSFYILVLPSNDFHSCERNTLSQNT